MVSDKDQRDGEKSRSSTGCSPYPPAALCPGGSITGAPKREVIAAIRSYEARPRGYFMGHAFYLDDGGRFDSSILIRTLVKDGAKPFEYAAGSGIVTKSHPESELREIDAKCGVVTAP